jgi:hypothetical protein
VIDLVYELKGVSPFPRDFAKNLVSKMFCNKDIEMSYDMLYRQEKTFFNKDIEISYDMLYRQEKTFFNKDIEMSFDILYRQEKLVSIGSSQIKPNLATTKQHVNTFLLDGLRVQFQNVLTALSLAMNLARLWR